MLQNLSQHIPVLEKLLVEIENTATNSIIYSDAPNVYDVDLPLLSSYLTYWWQLGPDGPTRTTYVYIQLVCEILELLHNKGGHPCEKTLFIVNQLWIC